jgi:hypothetical protein
VEVKEGCKVPQISSMNCFLRWCIIFAQEEILTAQADLGRNELLCRADPDTLIPSGMCEAAPREPKKKHDPYWSTL